MENGSSVQPGGSRWAIALPIADSDCRFSIGFFRYGLIFNWQSPIGNLIARYRMVSTDFIKSTIDIAQPNSFAQRAAKRRQKVARGKSRLVGTPPLDQFTKNFHSPERATEKRATDLRMNTDPNDSASRSGLGLICVYLRKSVADYHSPNNQSGRPRRNAPTDATQRLPFNEK
jgi:hypothetical protein